jgi:excisionase family DNA binding protein
MSVTELAARLGVHKGLVYDAVEAGEISCYRIGRKTIRFSRAHVDDYLASVERRARPVKAPLRRSQDTRQMNTLTRVRKQLGQEFG